MELQSSAHAILKAHEELDGMVSATGLADKTAAMDRVFWDLDRALASSCKETVKGAALKWDVACNRRHEG